VNVSNICPIEQYFNQVKHYIKKESPISFEDIKKTLAHSIKQVKEKHYQNYFIHAFNVEWQPEVSPRALCKRG